MTATPFADAASDYAERGWRVFKIPPGQKIPKDRWVNGAPWEVATNDTFEIGRRKGRYPDHNIGIATGQGLAVLDVDAHHGGVVPAWAPPTLVAKTPSGGVHLYYAVDGPVPNSQSKLAPGVDVRGDGGMVVAPPSVLHNVQGNEVHEHCRYEWVGETDGIFGVVTRIAATLLTPSGRESGNVFRGPKLGARSFGEGERHTAMLTLAGKMRSVGCEEPEIGDRKSVV